MSQTETLSRILVRDLRTLGAELQAYPDDMSIWATPPGIRNSAGTLAMHLVGNLRHFIGATLGQSGYIRDREREFSARNVSRAELLASVDAAVQEIGSALQKLHDEDLRKPFPLEIRGLRFATGMFLVHLTAHFGYHLGQLDYHRRLVTGSSEGVGAQSLDEIAE